MITPNQQFSKDVETALSRKKKEIRRYRRLQVLLMMMLVACGYLGYMTQAINDAILSGIIIFYVACIVFILLTLKHPLER